MSDRRFWDLRATSALLALPFIHAMLSVLYLWGYVTGFGANLGSFVGVSDLFSVSAGDMVSIYLIGLVPSAAFILSRHTGNFNPYVEDDIRQIKDDGEREVALKNLITVRKVLKVAFLLFSASMAAAFVKSIFFDLNVNWRAAWFLVWALSVAFWISIQQGLKISGLLSEIALSLWGLALCALFFAVLKGQGDRWSTYENRLATHISCENGVVLRRFSEMDLVVLADGKKALLGENCEVRYRVPEPRQLARVRD